MKSKKYLVYDCDLCEWVMCGETFSSIDEAKKWIATDPDLNSDYEIYELTKVLRVKIIPQIIEE